MSLGQGAIELRIPNHRCYGWPVVDHQDLRARRGPSAAFDDVSVDAAFSRPENTEETRRGLWPEPPNVQATFAAFVSRANAAAGGLPGKTELPPKPADAVPEDLAGALRSEAAMLVPDVQTIRPPAPGPKEKAEDGQVPTRELERMMADMAVLLRYGHQGSVVERLDDLLRRYPEDLLLLRRVAEFHLETGNEGPAKETLFRLASGLFERRNVEGMQAALEQVLVLEPGNPRAHKLLSLLKRRQSEIPGAG